MSTIKYLVFDVDNTLLDFDLSLIGTQKAVADRIGCHFSEEFYLTDKNLMYEAWNEYQMSDTDDQDIQERWHQHLECRSYGITSCCWSVLGWNSIPTSC